MLEHDQNGICYFRLSIIIHAVLVLDKGCCKQAQGKRLLLPAVNVCTSATALSDDVHTIDLK